jgi:dynein intermediate chain 3, axonemal
MEGVGELSLCKVCCSGNLTTAVSNDSTLAGDVRSHLLVSTEEGDVIFADLCGKKTAESSHGKDEKDKEEEEEVDNSRDYVRWITRDHSRPCVALHQSPFFPDVLLSVGDWNFHIWRVSHRLFIHCLLSHISPIILRLFYGFFSLFRFYMSLRF